MRKVKNCHGCFAHTNKSCLLRYKREKKIEGYNTDDGIKYVKVWSPVTCCHKPKTYKDFMVRLNEVNRIGVNYV